MPQMTPWEVACTWYDPAEIHRAITRSGWPQIGAARPIPRDVMSREFSEWLCEQCRLAMAKGIQIGIERAKEQTMPTKLDTPDEATMRQTRELLVADPNTRQRAVAMFPVRVQSMAAQLGSLLRLTARPDTDSENRQTLQAAADDWEQEIRREFVRWFGHDMIAQTKEERPCQTK